MHFFLIIDNIEVLLPFQNIWTFIPKSVNYFFQHFKTTVRLHKLQQSAIFFSLFNSNSSSWIREQKIAHKQLWSAVLDHNWSFFLAPGGPKCANFLRIILGWAAQHGVARGGASCALEPFVSEIASWLMIMAISVMEFQVRGYKIQYMFFL